MEPSYLVISLKSVLKATAMVVSNFFKTECILSMVVCCFTEQWFGLYVYVSKKSNWPVL